MGFEVGVRLIIFLCGLKATEKRKNNLQVIHTIQD